MAQLESSGGPLAGVRVLDFTTVTAGPYCTRLLADAGAEIIKVEPPTGDHKRSVPPLRDGYSTPFAQTNAGKKSVVLDLKTEPGRAAAIALALKSDVVVENWRPGVAARLGLSYGQLAALKPDIIHCAISGYGQEGPRAQRPAYAPILHADSGYELAQMRYQHGADRPAATGIFIGDIMSGLSAFGAVSAALHKLRATGEGSSIDVAMFDNMVNLLVFEFHEAMFERMPRRIFPPLKTQDGFIVVAPVSQRTFENLARCIGHPEWIGSEKFGTPAGRVQNWGELMAAVEAWTSQRSAADCEATLIRDEVPCSRYRTLAENLTDPYLFERGTLATATDGAGDLTITGAPFQMSGGVFPRPRVPDLGADTADVLRQVLGYDDDQIAAVRKAGAKNPSLADS